MITAPKHDVRKVLANRRKRISNTVKRRALKVEGREPVKGYIAKQNFPKNHLKKKEKAGKKKEREK